jgi:hypothetical protein
MRLGGSTRWPAPALLALLALACRSSKASTQDAGEPAALPRVAATPASPATPERPSAQPPAPQVEDEFQRLLAGMGVTFRPAEQELHVPGWVNMQSGLVEVFACAPQGKTHESVVVLDCVPSGLHAGLLALGLEPGTPVEFGTGDEYRPPTGDAVEIEVRWRDAAGAEHSARAEDWIWDDHRKQPMPRGGWIFAGSFLQPVSGASEEVTFAADYVKSLATTYHDASSILENPRTEGIDDTVYFSNQEAVPAVGTPITAVFRRAR